MNIVADEYSAENRYSVGDYVMHDYKLYKCATEISTPETWDEEKWDEWILTDSEVPLSVADKIIRGTYLRGAEISSQKRNTYASGCVYHVDTNGLMTAAYVNDIPMENFSVTRYDLSNIGNVGLVIGKAYHFNNSIPAYVVTDINGNIVYSHIEARECVTLTDIPLIKASNYKWLYINCRYSSQSEAVLYEADEHLNPFEEYSLEEVIDSRINSVEEKSAPITKKMFEGTVEKGTVVDKQFYKTYASAVVKVIGNPDVAKMDSNYSAMTVVKYQDLTQLVREYGNDLIVYKAYQLNSDIPAVEITDSNGNTLATYSSSEGQEAEDLRISIPSDAEYLYINSLVANQEDARLYSVKEYLSENETYNILEIVDECIENTAKFTELKNRQANDYDMMVKTVSYRGRGVENIIPSFLKAKDEGFKHVGTDIAFTLDNVPVLLADSTIDRTSNGYGTISSMNYEQVLRYNFNIDGETNDVVRIPTLEEFLKMCKYVGLNPYLNLKYDALYADEQISMIIQMVHKYGMRNKTTYFSRSLKFLNKVKGLDEKARLGYYIESDVDITAVDDIVVSCQSLQTDKNEVICILSFDSINVYDDICTPFVTADIPVEMYDFNTPNQVDNIDYYITGVLTRSPYHLGKLLYKQYIPDE